MTRYIIETYENGDIKIATDEEIRIYKQKYNNFLVNCIRYLYNELFITSRQYNSLENKYKEALDLVKYSQTGIMKSGENFTKCDQQNGLKRQ